MCPLPLSDDPWNLAHARKPSCDPPAQWGPVSHGGWHPLQHPPVRQPSFGGLSAECPPGLLSTVIFPPHPAADRQSLFKAFGPGGPSPSSAASNQAAGQSDQAWPAAMMAAAAQMDEQRLQQSRLCLLASLLPPGGASLLPGGRGSPDARPPLGGALPAGALPAGWDWLRCGGPAAGAPAAAPHPLLQALLQSVLNAGALTALRAGGEGFSP
jgi:hypothetical protein